MTRQRRSFALWCFAPLLAGATACSSAGGDAGDGARMPEETTATTAAAVTGSPALLIVTDAPMLPAARTLAAHKNATGVPTFVETVTDFKAILYPCLIQPCSWQNVPDDPAVIKQGIEYFHRTYNVQYVFLAGDETHVPTRYMTVWNNIPATATGYRPADLYYGDLYKTADGSFSTWDANQNGNYNEIAWGHSAYAFDPDLVDGDPEIAVGRLAVNDLASLSNYVAKVIAYETQTMTYAANSSFVADFNYAAPPSTSLAQTIAGDLHLVTGTQSFTEVNVPPGTAPAAGYTAIQPAGVATLAATSGWLTYVGHGSQIGWDPFDATWDNLFDGMTQLNMPVITGLGCQTGLFTAYSPDANPNVALGTPAPTPVPAIAATFSNHVLAAHPIGGGIAYAGETIIMPDTLGTEFADDMAKCFTAGAATLGGEWLCAQRAYFNAEYLSWTNPNVQGDTLREPRVYLGTMTLFGDPSLRLQRGSGPVAHPGAFGGAAVWGATCLPGEVCEMADVNRDGKADVVAFAHGTAGDVVNVSLSNGQGFSARAQWSSFFCQPTEQCAVGDVDGNGAADIIALNAGTGAAWVSLSNGVNAFAAPQEWAPSVAVAGATLKVADMDGDARADIVRIMPAAATPFSVFLSTGSSFVSTGAWGAPSFSTTATYEIGDVSGDGKADVIMFNRGANPYAYVALSSGSGIGAFAEWSSFLCLDGETCAVTDVDRDGNADVVAFTHNASPRVYVAFSTGVSFTAASLEDGFFCQSSETCAVGDVNGDRAADVIAFNPSAQTWVALAPNVLR